MKKQNASEKKWLLGKNLLTNEDRWVPEVLCLRQKASLNTRGLSTGCAAGVLLDAAITSAIFELVERDAASLWWEGGRPPRPVSNEALVDAEIETVFKLAGRTGNKKLRPARLRKGNLCDFLHPQPHHIALRKDPHLANSQNAL